MRQNYYTVLGINPQASSDEVKRAYRKLAKASHPDVNPSPKAAENFVQITEAFEILSDPSKRAVYDYKLKRDRRPPVQMTGTAHRQKTEQQRAYEAWVRQARAEARRNAQMKYDDFKRSRVEKAELEIYHYLQYFIIGLVFLFALILMLLPFAAMLRVRWWLIVSAIPLAPVSLRLMKECRRGFKELNS